MPWTLSSWEPTATKLSQQGNPWLLSERPVLKPMLDHKLMLAEVMIQGCAPAEPSGLWFLPNFFSPVTRKS